MARTNGNDALVAMFAPRFPELKALFDACDSKKAVAALKKRIEKQLEGGHWDIVDGERVYVEPVTDVPANYGAVDAFAKAARETFAEPSCAVKSAAEMRVAMADRYLSRSNRVGRLR